MKHLLSYTEKMLLETVIHFDSDFEQSIKDIFKGSKQEHIIKDLLKLKDKDIDVKSNKPMFLIKGNAGSNMINITDKDPMKLGRLIKLLLPDTSPNDIQTITDKWVGSIKQDLEELDGFDIAEYYKEENTEDIGKTELKDSCMLGKDESILDLYVYNQKNIGIIVKLNEEGLLTTRALIFKTLEKGWCMSRIYFNRRYEKVIFENYAKDNNIYHLNTVRDWEDETLTVQLDESEFDMYPYLDHFKYLNIDKKQLSTTWNQWEGNGDTIYVLRESDGGFKILQGAEGIINNIDELVDKFYDVLQNPNQYSDYYNLINRVNDYLEEFCKYNDDFDTVDDMTEDDIKEQLYNFFEYDYSGTLTDYPSEI